jgi:hypothetical protein
MVRDPFLPLLPSVGPALAPTGMNFPAGTSNAVDSMWSGGVLPTMAANGSAGQVPAADALRGDFASAFRVDIGAAMIDTSTQNGAFMTLPDQPLLVPILAQRYFSGEEEQFGKNMPLFNLRGGGQQYGPPKRIGASRFHGEWDSSTGGERLLYKTPGFAFTATHVLINQMQGRLRAVSQLRGAASDAARHADKRRGAGTAVHEEPVSESEHLLGALAASDAQSLYEKIEWLGAIESVELAGNSPSGERFFNYGALLGTNKIYNLFSSRLLRGERLYWAVADYDTDEMAKIASRCGLERLSISGAKRSIETVVGSDGRSSASLRFPQLRGWSSGDANLYAKSIDPKEWLDTPALDLFYKSRERRLLVEYQEFAYDATLDAVVPVKGSFETEQEQLDLMPSIVFDEYMVSAAIIPVGTVKTQAAKPTSPHAIHLGHYSYDALRLLPIVEIFRHNGN